MCVTYPLHAAAWAHVWSLSSFAFTSFPTNRKRMFQSLRGMYKTLWFIFPLLVTAGNFFLVKSKQWSITQAAFWLVELLQGYVLWPTSSKKRRLWKPKQWWLNRVLLAKAGLSRYFLPTSRILLNQLFHSPKWAQWGRRPNGLLTQSPFGLEE